MEKFNYLDAVDFAATVCDKEGVVLYQNARAIASAASVLHTTANMAICPFV